MSLHDFLLDAAQEDPGRTFIEYDGTQYPFFMVAEQAKMVAAGLRKHGVTEGDSVGVMLPNVPPFVTSYYGTIMNGSTFVPMNVMLQPEEVAYLVEDSQIKAIVVLDMFLGSVHAAVSNMKNPPVVFVLPSGKIDPPAEMAEHKAFPELMAEVDESFEPAQIDPSLPIMTLYTSGTTGKPKGAQITGANILANLDMMEEIIEVEPDDKALCVLPLFHCFALNGVLNASVRNRTAVVLHPRFDVEACLASLENDGITSMAGVPTMFFHLLKHPEFSKEKVKSLRYTVSGGAAMPMEVMSQFETMTEVPIYEGFGMTETTVSVCINRPDNRKPGSIGTPFEGVEMKIFDDDDNELPNGEVGELVIKAPNIMCGYLNKEKDTAEAMRNGWFHTGDMGYKDDDGFFFIVDRKKDMVIKGGFNIYPREIEEVLYRLPQVAECAVVGVFDEEKGELVQAVIACKPEQKLTAEEADTHLREHLAKYKLPHDYTFIDELPKGPTGKILKREIRDMWVQWNRDRVPAKT